MPKRGKFIVIEGGEGAGKSTFVEGLKKELYEHDIVYTHEPGGTEVAEEIRQIVKNQRSEEIHPETELMLFCGARVQHVKNLIIPSLTKGQHVISDRFSLSTLAYQIHARNREDLFELYMANNEIAVGGCKPDFHVFLNISPRDSIKRVSHRRKEITRFENEKLAFHKRLQKGYLKYLGTHVYPHCIIDASKPKETVLEEGLRCIKRILGVT